MAALRGLLPERPIFAPEPGHLVTMERGVVRESCEPSPFLATLDRSAWPSREYVGDVDVLAAYSPGASKKS